MVQYILPKAFINFSTKQSENKSHYVKQTVSKGEGEAPLIRRRIGGVLRVGTLKTAGISFDHRTRERFP